MVKGSAGGKAWALIQKREAVHRYWLNPSYCKECRNVLMPTKSTKKISDVRTKSFCNQSCAAFFNNRKKPRKSKEPKAKKMKTKAIFLRTKAEIFSKGLNWQASRSNIQKTARFVFFKVFPNPSCYVCGYSLHVDVAHIKSVSSFSPTAYLYQINHISNLIGLCKNHHWEYDNNYLCLLRANLSSP